MSGGSGAASTVACRIETAVLGTYYEGGVRRVVKLLITGTVYNDDSWVLAFHPPNDPLRGRQLTGTGGQEHLEIWREFALANTPTDELSSLRG
jgi:hypothetical protein